MRMQLQQHIVGSSCHGVADAAIAGPQERTTLICTCIETKTALTQNQSLPQVCAQMVAAYEKNCNNGIKLSEVWGVATNLTNFSFLRFKPSDKKMQYYKKSALSLLPPGDFDEVTLETLQRSNAVEILRMLKFIASRSKELIDNAKFDEQYYQRQLDKAVEKEVFNVYWPDSCDEPLLANLRISSLQSLKESLYKAFASEGYTPETKPINKMYIKLNFNGKIEKSYIKNDGSVKALHQLLYDKASRIQRLYIQ
ncbi:hypothetical protein AKO1_014008 [Acrasis kona]|uniref:Uncharacterized protein n=1 Tax=Acrasis kona TaxID=1008807 RepID=A0AAW2Z2Y5_9EUKA